MSKVYDVNRIATYGGSTCVFYLKETLVNAGWVVSQSSDGDTFYSASDGITTDGSGPGGMNNPLAWYFIKDPANRRGFSVQRSSGSDAQAGDQMWRVVNYEDVATGVINGSVSRSCIIVDINTALTGCGSGSTTFNPLFERMFETSGSFRCHTIAQNVPYNGVYAWYNFTSTTGSITGRTTSLWHHEPLISSSIIDESPVIYRTQRCFQPNYGYGTSYSTNYTYYTVAAAVTSLLVGGECNGFLSYGFSGQIKANFGPQASLTLLNANGSAATYQIFNQDVMPQNSGMLTDTLMFIEMYTILAQSGHVGAPPGRFRGYPYKTRWVTRSSTTLDGRRRYPDVFNISTDALVCVGHFAIPWPENVFPLS